MFIDKRIENDIKYFKSSTSLNQEKNYLETVKDFLKHKLKDFNKV